MAYRTRVFIDFWNFQINWNARASGSHIDWRQVPQVLLQEADRQLKLVGITDGLTLEETLVYASYNPTSDAKLKGWLTGWLDSQPSFNVKARERKPKLRTIHCQECNTDNSTCASCGEPFKWAPEKGVDTAIVTDLLSLASEGAYDVAVLLSSDADHIPAVEWVQGRGLKVVNATWNNHGYDLKTSCWAAFPLDTAIPQLTRS